MLLKVFLWASFFAIIAFFTYKQSSTEVITFEESIFIPGASKLEVFDFIKDVKVSMRGHHSSQSVTDVIHIIGDDDKPDQIKFNHLEKVSIQGLYEQVLETPCIASLFPLIPKIQLDQYLFDGLIHGTVTIIFKDGSKDGKTGTLLMEYFEIVTPYFFAKFTKEGSKSANKLFLENAKLHFKDRS